MAFTPTRPPSSSLLVLFTRQTFGPRRPTNPDLDAERDTLGARPPSSARADSPPQDRRVSGVPFGRVGSGVYGLGVSSRAARQTW